VATPTHASFNAATFAPVDRVMVLRINVEGDEIAIMDPLAALPKTPDSRFGAPALRRKARVRDASVATLRQEGERTAGDGGDHARGATLSGGGERDDRRGDGWRPCGLVEADAAGDRRRHRLRPSRCRRRPEAIRH
jgi:hypothetical protein